MTTKFPEAWLAQINQVVKAVRRQHGYGEIYATVDPPRLPGNPPLLRVEMGGTVEVVPLTLRAVEHMMITGQPGPVLIEVKQAFVRVLKTVERRGRKKGGQTRRSYM
jgi:hypothetical protein